MTVRRKTRVRRLVFHAELRDEVQQLEHSWKRVDAGGYVSLLRKCGSAKAAAEGRKIHAHIIKSGLDRDTFVGNFIIHMYGNCGLMDEARAAFNRIHKHNLYSRTILLAAYAHSRDLANARKTFEDIPTKNTVAWNTMITAYAQNGHLEMAKSMFNVMPDRNVVSWSTMISAYVRAEHLDANSKCKHKLDLFRLMDLEGIQVDKTACLSVLDGVKDLDLGKLILSNIDGTGLELDLMVAATLVNMFAKCRDLTSARRLFDQMPERSIVSWNALVQGYSQVRKMQEAEKVFYRMPERDAVAWNCIVTAYTQNGQVKEASIMFHEMPEPDQISWTAILVAYAQNGYVDDAKITFDKMPIRSVVSWTAMVAAYAQNGLHRNALELFRMMDLEGVQPNQVTVVSVLDACANLSAVKDGKIIHSHISETFLTLIVEVGSSLINMYGKSGCLDLAKGVFEAMRADNEVMWTVMILAYARAGNGAKALELYIEMMVEGIFPDEVTFISIISACSHMGLVVSNCACYFVSMFDHNLVPTLDHYTCIIDVLGRAGKLEEAEALIVTMPYEPDVTAWMTLLSACRNHNDTERGQRAADQIIQLDPNSLSPYPLLTDICWHSST